MARLARLVIPGLPHHVTQRGNRRQQTFFCEEDYAADQLPPEVAGLLVARALRFLRHGRAIPAGNDCRLARLLEQCNPRGGTPGFAGARAYWPFLGKCDVCRTPGANHRPNPPSRNTWTPVQITQTTIIGSCPRNPPRLDCPPWTVAAGCGAGQNWDRKAPGKSGTDD